LNTEKDHSVSSNGLKTLKDLRSVSKNSTDNLHNSNNGSHKDLRSLGNQYISNNTINRVSERRKSYFDKAS
jgi:hypothetical protein